MKSIGLIQLVASLFGLFVVTSLLVGYDMKPMFEVLNTTTGYWEAPIAKPTVSSEGVSIDGDDVGTELDCRWDEDAYQADNTTGWVVLTMDLYTGDLEDTGVY